MNMNYYVDHIRDQLTVYGLLETELSDDAWTKVVETAMQELLRYYDQTGFVAVPAASCIDLSEVEKNNNIKISSISNVYNTTIPGNITSNGGYYSGDFYTDPAWLGFWQTGYGSRLTQWSYNYINYDSLNKIKNTIAGSDLDFREDKIHKKLYINLISNSSYLTLEYVPFIRTVEDIVGDYWVDILKRLSLAYAKIAVGRARTRFVQNGALWTDDGATILQEGITELTALRERLQVNADFMYPVD